MVSLCSFLTADLQWIAYYYCCIRLLAGGSILGDAIVLIQLLHYF